MMEDCIHDYQRLRCIHREKTVKGTLTANMERCTICGNEIYINWHIRDEASTEPKLAEYK